MGWQGRLTCPTPAPSVPPTVIPAPFQQFAVKNKQNTTTETNLSYETEREKVKSSSLRSDTRVVWRGVPGQCLPPLARRLGAWRPLRVWGSRGRRPLPPGSRDCTLWLILNLEHSVSWLGCGRLFSPRRCCQGRGLPDLAKKKKKKKSPNKQWNTLLGEEQSSFT